MSSGSTDDVSKENVTVVQETRERSIDVHTDCESDERRYIGGWRLWILSLSVALCLFLVNIEVSVVGTSLVSISEDLNGFHNSTWVITGYLITYTSMIVLWAKLSDLTGRKFATIATVTIFVAFSAGCGAAQSMNQLIVCRVFQGIGAAGCASLSLTLAYEMVPEEKYPQQAAQLSVAIAFGSLVGPLIGGGASQNSQWRWVFLFNVPAGAVTIILLWMTLPKNFPNQGNPSHVGTLEGLLAARSSLARIDGLGAFLLLGASMLLIAVLLEGGVSIEWSSKTSIALFTTSGILWLAFAGNEWYFTSDKHRTEPIFPWRFVTNRVWMGTLIISMLSGIPYNILIIDIPQRLQTISGLSPFQAGVRLIPFNFLISFGTVVINIVAKVTGILPINLILFGSIIQLIGLALFCTLPTDGSIPAAMYGYQSIAGFGIGCVIGILLQMPPKVVGKRDLAISGGALLQLRVFGGALGLSIATSAMDNYLSANLPAGVSGLSASSPLQFVEALHNYPPDIQAQILTRAAEGYNLQSEIMAGFAGLQVLLVGMLWRKDPIRIVKVKV